MSIFRLPFPNVQGLKFRHQLLKNFVLDPNSMFFLVIFWCELARDHAFKLGPEVLEYIFN